MIFLLPSPVLFEKERCHFCHHKRFFPSIKLCPGEGFFSGFSNPVRFADNTYHCYTHIIILAINRDWCTLLLSTGLILLLLELLSPSHCLWISAALFTTSLISLVYINISLSPFYCLIVFVLFFDSSLSTRCFPCLVCGICCVFTTYFFPLIMLIVNETVLHKPSLWRKYTVRLLRKPTRTELRHETRAFLKKNWVFWAFLMPPVLNLQETFITNSFLEHYPHDRG